MRIIAAIGRLGIDLEARIQPKGKATITHGDDVEVHDVSGEHELAPHIIGFIPDKETD